MTEDHPRGNRETEARLDERGGRFRHPQPMPSGPQLALDWAQIRSPQQQSAQVHITVGSVLVVTMGIGCDTAVDFTVTSGPVRITGTQPAPLPNSGSNSVQLTGTSAGTATVSVIGRRSCSTEGVTTGSCYGVAGPLGTITINVGTI